MNNAISINNGDSRHEIKIENGKMGSTGALNQKHDQGYAEGVEFKYGFISSTEGTSDRASRIRKWYALRGTKIEYWSVESDHVTCAELVSDKTSGGIKQRIMFFEDRDSFDTPDYAAGFYVISWKDRGRRGDDGNKVNNSYHVKVTLGDPSQNTGEVIASLNVKEGEIIPGEWRDRCLLMRLKRSQEFNTGREDIWLSMECEEGGTFGTLITEVDIHPVTLKAFPAPLFGVLERLVVPQEDDHSDTLGYVDGRNTDTIAWIDYAETGSGQESSPRMPSLHFEIKGLDAGRFSWKTRLTVSYSRPAIQYADAPAGTRDRNRAVLAKDTVHIPSIPENWKEQPVSLWNIAEDTDWLGEVNEGFFGGNASLEFEIKSKNGHSSYTGADIYRFRIGGQNPDDQMCTRYIQSYVLQMYPDTLASMEWCLPAVGKSESFGYGGEAVYYPFSWSNAPSSLYNQFLAGGGKYRREPGAEGIPLHSQDTAGAGGYGIFQVTGTAGGDGIYTAIPREQIWNWQKNIQAALQIILVKYNEAHRWMLRQLQQQQAEAPESALPVYRAADTNPGQGVPYDYSFAEGTACTIAQLCTLKAYNGASKCSRQINEPGTKVRSPGFLYDPGKSGHYCAWMNTSRQWCISRYNSNNFDYVDRVLSRVNQI